MVTSVYVGGISIISGYNMIAVIFVGLQCMAVEMWITLRLVHYSKNYQFLFFYLSQ